MYGHPLVKIGIIAAFFAGVAAPAPAQDITVRHGTFIFERGEGGILDISGNRGFRLEAGALTSGRFDAVDQCRFTPECPEGTVLELGGVWIGLDLPGTARFRGKTYGDLGGFDSPNSAGIEFFGKFTMPPIGDGPVSISVPFTFAGTFLYGDAQGSQTALLSGGGEVTLFLEPFPGENSWQVQAAEFEFRPNAKLNRRSG
jgi:hypothetical protein